jgi:subtilisin family serine protease
VIDKLDEPYSDEYAKYQYYLDDSKIVEVKDLVTDTFRPVIAVIDNGVNINHPDIIGRTWTNENEIP